MRKFLAGGIFAVIFGVILYIFWKEEVRYKLPTPVPENYQPVANGKLINLPPGIRVSQTKPVFLHFFNPLCPCSRFNIKHVKSLIKTYGASVNFAVIVISDEEYTTAQINRKYDLGVPVIFDTTMAAQCGVYSTPQAVIIDNSGKLYYRGNYNRTRYCADKKTEYARMALESLLKEQPPIQFDNWATTAYGCILSTCSKK